MNWLKKIILFVCNLILFSGCAGGKHYHKGTSFIQNPDFELFGASLKETAVSYEIESYFQSSIIGRTEYIYENLNITLPKDLEVNQTIPVGQSLKVWYAKGGQGGQIETEEAEGSVVIRKKDENEVFLELNLKFKNFKIVGHVSSAPETVERKGLLSAVKGYKIY
ncbi:MAG TPA: hypothetical protein DHW82_02325 [Spirochaetia bacterium]|nr:MAG: hypothetical protein A2Y41_00730 [Spirochaetes bacterium GWB1_36_13]HCL55828.1 hypothetical protein [Spirochaetia bacterium]